MVKEFILFNKKIWQQIKVFFTLPQANDFDPQQEISVVLAQGRARILTTMLRYALILSTILFAPVFINRIQFWRSGDSLKTIPIDVAAIAWIWILNFWKPLSFKVRSLLFLAMLYLFATLELYFYGLAEQWYPFFSAFILLTTVFLGGRAGVGALLLSVATFTVIAWQISTGAIVITLSEMVVPIPDKVNIFIFIITLFLINGVLVAVMATLLREFKIAWTRERESAHMVQQERDQLEQRVVERTQQIEDRSRELDKSRHTAIAAQKTAEAANKTKSVFLANMSHELRTPLNAILGFSQLMARGDDLSAKQQEYVGIINRSGEHLLTLINDILDISKIEAGRMSPDSHEIDLFYLLDTLENMFRLKANNKGLQLQFQRPPNAPRFIKTDEVKLRQILINQLNNAIKFTTAGQVTVRVAPVNQARLRFEVEDTGPGIAPEEMDSLFDAFVQSKAGYSAHEGTGLGLAISSQYVRLLGGKMALTSKVGRGSCFQFEIEADTTDGQTVSNPTVQRVVGLAPGQPDYRILIADDNWDNRHLLTAILKPVGFTLREADNGQEALNQWQMWQPHLILLDIRMPVADGLEVTRQIRASADELQPVIIAISASSLMPEQREAPLNAGCDDFISKPFQEQEIFEKVGQYLNVRYLYRDAGSIVDTPAQTAAQNGSNLQASLGKMPADWLEEMQYAAATVDGELAHQLITKIQSDHPQLAQKLTHLVDDFQFNKLKDLLTIADN